MGGILNAGPGQTNHELRAAAIAPTPAIGPAAGRGRSIRLPGAAGPAARFALMKPAISPSKLVPRRGLAEIVVGADFVGVIAVLVGGPRGNHDDRHALELVVGADVAHQVEAVHARHLDIRQNDVGITSIICSRASTPSLAVTTW